MYTATNNQAILRPPEAIDFQDIIKTTLGMHSRAEYPVGPQ